MKIVKQNWIYLSLATLLITFMGGCASFFAAPEETIPAIEAPKETFEDEVAATDASGDEVPEREVSGSSSAHRHIDRQRLQVADPVWGTFYLEIDDYGHPSFAPVSMSIAVLCKEQVTMRRQRPAPRKEYLVRNVKVCSFDGHSYDANAKIMTVNYKTQSQEFRPDEPVCNEAWSQEFVLNEACAKWARRSP